MIADRHVVRLASVPTEREAALLLSALREQGITSTMSGQTTAGFRAEAPGEVQVLVFDDDLAAARQVVAAVTKGASVDWSQVDVGQPEEPNASSAESGLLSRTIWRPLILAGFVCVALLWLVRLVSLWRP